MDKIIDDNNKIVGNINLDNSNIKFIGKNNILYVDNGITLVNSSIEFRGDNSFYEPPLNTFLLLSFYQF